MRKLTGAAFVSLDGVMQAPGGPEEDTSSDFHLGGWVFDYWDESLEEPFGKVMDSDYDLLLGRRTYDIFAGYWPDHQDVPIGARFQRINKYVLTHRQDPLAWNGSHRLSGDTAQVVAELKRSQGRDLLIQGSSTLYAPLLSAGLIDDLILMVFPVVLGKGKRLLGDGHLPGSLSLVHHAVSNKGVVFLHYQPSGEVGVGSFATDEGQEELARRARAEAGCE